MPAAVFALGRAEEVRYYGECRRQCIHTYVARKGHSSIQWPGIWQVWQTYPALGGARVNGPALDTLA